MITRFDKLQTELPHPENPSPNSAAAVQELLGGKFGEMSTFMNYTYQSFNFRGRSEMRPFYDLIANIAAEEFGHIELVSYAINLLLTGTTERGDDPVDDPARVGGGRPQQLPLPRQRPAGPADGLAGQLLDRRERVLQRQPQAGPAAQLLPRVRRAGRRRSGSTRRSTIRPPARCVGFLLVRGGVHIVAYAKALEKLSGVDVGKLLPIPDISNKRFPEAAQARGAGAAPDPLPVQPRGLPAGRRDLERPASGGRERAGSPGRRARGLRLRPTSTRSRS